MLTPYQFAGNTPIQAIDFEGLEPKWVVDFARFFGNELTLDVEQKSIFNGLLDIYNCTFTFCFYTDLFTIPLSFHLISSR
jgi:hypothetical protein